MSLFTPSVQRLEITDTLTTLQERLGYRGWASLGEIETNRAGELPVTTLDKLPALCASLRRYPLSVVVPDRWCKIYLTHPPTNATRVDDLRDAAAARLQLVYDADPSTYYIQSDLSATAPFLCCAMERAVVDRLRAVGQGCGARVESIRPQYVESLANWKSAIADTNPWLISCDDTAVTIGMFANRRCAALVQTRWNDIDWSEPTQVGEAATRESIRANSPRPSSITLAGPPVRLVGRVRMHDMDFRPLASPASARYSHRLEAPPESPRKAMT